MRTRLLRASEITTALETEKVTTKSKNLLVFNKKYFYFLQIRWAKQYEELQRQSDLIIGNSLVSAASVNYLGAMTQDYRTYLN